MLSLNTVIYEYEKVIFRLDHILHRIIYFNVF